jgi:hypothetical protein
MPSTNLKAVATDVAPDPLEAARSDVAASERRLSERRKKLEEIRARRVAVESEIKTASVSGEVSSLGGLSSERATLADAETALLSHALPALEEALRSAKERQTAINRERYAVRQADEKNRLEAELAALDARDAASLSAVAADLRKRPSLLAALGRRPDEVPRFLGVSADDIQTIVAAHAAAVHAADLERMRGFDPMAEFRAQRARLDEAAARQRAIEEEPSRVVARWA